MNEINELCLLRRIAQPLQRLLVLLVFAGLCITLDRPSVAQEQTDAPVAADTCILELTLPEDATVTLNGKEYRTQRTFTYKPLTPGRRYHADVVVRFGSDETEHRSVLIEGGRRLRLSMHGRRGSLLELVPQTAPVWPMGLDVSADEQLVVFGGNDGTASLWNLETGRKLRTYRAQELSAYPIAFHPDGRSLLLGAGQQILHIDLATGRKLRELHGIPTVAQEMMVSDNGRRLVAYSLMQQGKEFFPRTLVWDLPTARKVQEISHPAWHSNPVFAPHGGAGVTWNRLAKSRGTEPSNQYREPTLWDLVRGTRRWSFETENEIHTAAFSPDSALVALGMGNRVYGGGKSEYRGDVVVYDSITGRELARLATEPGNSYEERGDVTLVQFAAGGKQLLVFAPSEGLLLWDLDSRTTAWRQRPQIDDAYWCACSQDGRTVALGGAYYAEPETEENRWNRRRDSATYALDAATGRVMWSVGRSGRMRFLKSGERLLIDDGVWNVTNGEQVLDLRGSSQPVWSIRFGTSAGQVLINNSLWDLNEGRRLHTFGKDIGSLGSSGRLARSARMVATIERSSDGDSAVVWDTGSHSQLFTARGHEKPMQTVCLSGDGHFLATGAFDQQAIIWDLTSGSILHRLSHESSVWSMQFSPDGRFLATAAGGFFQPYPNGDGNFKITIWDVRRGIPVRSLEGHPQQFLLAFSPDGRTLLTGGDVRTLILWDVASGKPIRTFEDDMRIVLSIAFSRDGRMFAATSRDGKVVIWDAHTGRRLRVFQDPSGWTRACAFSPDQRYLLTGSEAVRIWDIGTGEEIAQLFNVDEDTDWLATMPRGQFDGSDKGRQAVAFRVRGGLNVVPVDRFFQDFYYPGLLAAIWRGERPLPHVELGNKLAPLVRIRAPAEPMVTVDSPSVMLSVEVTDQGGGIRGPWLLHNGANVLTPGHAEREGKALRRTFTVPLLQGENRLEVRAASEDGSWESEPAAVLVRYEQPLTPPNLYLLAVGVNRYAEQTMNLNFAAADARAMAALFKERGPALYGEGKIRSTLLLDEAATKDSIGDALNDIAKTAKPQDVLVVFLAGHGTMVGQRYFFIPHEFKKQAESLEDDIKAQGLAADVLGDSLATAPALKRVVIYDTCQSGGAVGLARTARNPFAFRGALERLSRSQGVFTIAATAASDDAQEVPELGHGVLTYSLLAAFQSVDKGPLAKQALKPAEGSVVDVREWFSFAQDRVPRLTGLYFGQEQFVAFSAHGQSFPLLPLEADK